MTEFPSFLFGHRILENVDDYTYLGVIFNYNGSFDKAIAKQILQGKRAFYALLARVKKLRIPIDIALELFNHMVLPILLYGSEIWGFQNITQIEVLYRKFLKCLLHVNSNTPNVMVYGETSTHPIEIHVVTRMITFYMRILNGKQNKLSTIMFTLLKRKMSYDDSFMSKWISMVKLQLESIGLMDLWTFSGCGLTTDHVKEMVKLRLNDQFKQKWYVDMREHEFW